MVAVQQRDSHPELVQAVARRLVPLRWPHSQKLFAYYDLDTHALVYQDSRGRVLDRVDLTLYRSEAPREP